MDVFRPVAGRINPSTWDIDVNNKGVPFTVTRKSTPPPPNIMKNGDILVKRYVHYKLPRNVAAGKAPLLTVHYIYWADGSAFLAIGRFHGPYFP